MQAKYVFFFNLDFANNVSMHLRHAQEHSHAGIGLGSIP